MTQKVFDPAKYRSIYAILPTPFNKDLSVDYGALESIVEFCIECGTRFGE